MAYADTLPKYDGREAPLGTSLLARLWFGALGLGCLAAIPGLWLAGIGAHLPEEALIKLGLSVFLAFAGLSGLGFARSAR